MSEQTSVPRRNRVIVGVDGSVPSIRALLWARFIADSTDSGIQAIGVWELPAAWGVGVPAVAVDTDLGPATEAMLKEASAQAFGADPPSSLSLMARLGGASQVLLEASESATMLILGSRGHGAVAGLLLGSVSKTCVERATCPVLVVHEQTPPPPPS